VLGFGFLGAIAKPLAKYLAPLAVIVVSCVTALIVMNPTGFLMLLASTGWFIVRAILGVVEVLFAIVYWGAKNVLVAIANVFIAAANLFIATINGVANTIVTWIRRVLPGIPDWNPIPQLNYLYVSPMPQTVYDVMAELGLGWQGIVFSAQTYWQGVQSWAPWSYMTGAGAGVGVGYGLKDKVFSPSYREYEVRRRTCKPKPPKQTRRGKLPSGGPMERKKRIPPDRRR